jgi:hypothetical protein
MTLFVVELSRVLFFRGKTLDRMRKAEHPPELTKRKLFRDTQHLRCVSRRRSMKTLFCLFDRVVVGARRRRDVDVRGPPAWLPEAFA